MSESIMEVRKQPRTEGSQRCTGFYLKVSPKARVLHYRDHLGNHVHHFSVAPKHTQLLLSAEATVQTFAPLELPEALPMSAWDDLDAMLARQDYWEFLMPSDYTEPTEGSELLARELRVERREDPLSMMRELNTAMYKAFEYVPNHTSVNSPIDHAIRDRKGVCQDFAHIMTVLARRLKIPCRYVSGYVYRGRSDQDRSVDGASHAWVEVMLPHVGWVGWDPTNNLLAGERHIRTAIGRDYSDVPPTRGTYRGNAESELGVIVRVRKAEAPAEDDLSKELLFQAVPAVFDENLRMSEAAEAQQQQQQQ